MPIVALEKLFKQLEPWGQDPEDRRFGDISDRVLAHLRWVIEESFELEAKHEIGCAFYERSDNRKDYRNGYRTRDILTRFGMLKDVKVPRLRYSSFLPSLLRKGRIALADVEKLIAKCLLCGASRAEVKEMLTITLGYPPCDSLISRVQRQLDEMAHQFRTRPLTKRYRYLFLDAIYVKIREGILAKECAVLVAVAIDDSGYKEVIGYMKARKETATAWRALLNQLVQRGLDPEGLDLVISDDSPAISIAVEEVFPEVEHQLCWAHRMARLAKAIEKEDRIECAKDLRAVYQAKSRQEALRAYRLWRVRWASKYPSFAAELDKDMGKLLSFFSCPSSHWVYIRTNNPIERLMRDIRAHTFGWAGFQNKQSCYRLLFGVFWRCNRKWKHDPKLDFTHSS